jgi:hypothetical protein
MFKIMRVVILATTVFLPSDGQAAQYQLGKPFPMTCDGTLVYHKDISSLEQDSDSDSEP